MIRNWYHAVCMCRYNAPCTLWSLPTEYISEAKWLNPLSRWRSHSIIVCIQCHLCGEIFLLFTPLGWLCLVPRAHPQQSDLVHMYVLAIPINFAIARVVWICWFYCKDSVSYQKGYLAWVISEMTCYSRYVQTDIPNARDICSYQLL